MIRAVIFDMYETLVTLYACPAFMGKQIAAAAGISEQKFREIWNPSEDDRTLGKRSVEDVIEEILRVNGRYTPALYEALVTKRKVTAGEHFRYLHSEILPLFDALKARGIRIGLITNCYFEERDVIRKTALFPYFDSVCMSCEVGLKKPDPAIYERSMQELAVASEECLYVGDGGSRELETAQAIGMHPLQATWYLKEGTGQPVGRLPEFPQAETPTDVLRVIDTIN
ncbi:MAG: HAD family hydrolase [Ruminococcaceae bacterium]|nr:HAD family hydrolase [Oscillospiraceae bacterium]